MRTIYKETDLTVNNEKDLPDLHISADPCFL